MQPFKKSQLLFLRMLIPVLALAITSSAQKKNYTIHPDNYSVNEYVISINKLLLPILNNGSVLQCDFEESHLTNSSGFFLSGFTNNTLWTNVNFPSDNKIHYQPGVVNVDPISEINKIFVLKSTDTPFGQAWQQWIDAVQLGADYYDGNSNGIYDPVDLNGNGEWDINEDRPDLIGDETAWCVYNDGAVPTSGPFQSIPRKVEIHQTVFGFASNNNNLDKALFIRYRIYNRSTDDWDKVYFSSVADPDIGNYENDLGGCDTLLNVGYAYNIEEEDTVWYGVNPPAFGINLLQGPAVYISGETYLDNNQNNVYDDGIDNPLDTASYSYGPVKGMKEMPGAMNLKLATYTCYHKFPLSMGVPGTPLNIRDYQLGGVSADGNQIDICNWSFGNGSDLPNCEKINPKFMYSGNPVVGEGWLHKFQTDQRIMINTGPFSIKSKESVNIIVSYIVGRGNNPIEGVTKMKETAVRTSALFYKNFIDTPVHVETEINFPTSFQLFQNYPNPFNPSTTIEFTLPISSRIKVKIYNLLGQVVKVLYDGFKEAGYHNLIWNSNEGNDKYLSSGVYFYELTAARSNGKELHHIKKMILMK